MKECKQLESTQTYGKLLSYWTLWGSAEGWTWKYDYWSRDLRF